MTHSGSKGIFASFAGVGGNLKKTTRRGLAAAVVVALSAATTPAVADPISYTWTMSGSHGPLQYGNELEFSANEDSSVKLKVRSYSSANDSGDLIDAYTDLFSGGIGVKNQNESSGSPSHAIDNSGDNDLVLIEFDSDDYTPLSFMIGWRQNDSDMRFWIGGEGEGLDLTSDPLCGGACSVDDLALLGFTSLPQFWNVDVDTLVDFETSLAGRYLIVTGGNENNKDYFKLEQIVAEVSSDTTDVSEPGTLTIFALGLAGMGLFRRKRAT